VLAFGTVTLQSIYGAISAYLVLGFMFAAAFAAIYHFSGDQFFVPGETANTQTFQYFSYTTLTTLGYGDFTAHYSSGQAVAVLEALTGQIFLATLVARLVAAFRVRDPQD
jgi:voltage-gated potassium channel Kch